MARKSKGQQPRAITSDSLAIQPYFRGSMFAELQKFPNKEKTRQLILGETDIQELDNIVETYGLDLTVSEDRALHAIQVLLDRTDYQGNIPGEEIYSTAFKYQGFLPRLSITYAQYYEAYGIQRAKDNRYHGAQAEEALQALRSLTKTRIICYKRRRWEGKGKSKELKTDIIRVTLPLIQLTEGFVGLDEEEAAQVLAGQELPQKRQTRLVIEVSPLLVDQIDSFYLLKPTALHNEIKQLLGAKRISRAVSLFIEWLLTKNSRTVRIPRGDLAERLRLDYLIDQRHQERLDSRLQEAFQTAKGLGYLLDYQEEPTGLLVFTLNPVRCKRIEQGRPEEEEV